MGIFDQMLENDISARLKNSPPKKPAEEKNGSAVPSSPNAACEKCGSLQFWLDGYGNWNCGGCVPLPRVLASVREVHTVNPNAETVEVDGQTWVRRECNGRPGWELAGIPEKNHWWVKCDFETKGGRAISRS